MPSITRDRGCLYYIPWIATFCVCILIAGVGVWAYYTNYCEDRTRDGLNTLDVDSDALGVFRPILIATAVTYLVIAVIIYIMSLWRSFIEAAHDSTGLVSSGSTAFLAMGVILNTFWWFCVVWTVFVIVADSLWMGTINTLMKVIQYHIEQLDDWGIPAWLPSSGLPCPGQCLNLDMFDYIDAALKDACVCDPAKLGTAKTQFQKAYDNLIGVQVGIWVMFASGLCLLMNYACMISHTKREVELLRRIALKPIM